MTRDIKRGQPNNPGQFAPDTRGKTHTPTEQRATAAAPPAPTPPPDYSRIHETFQRLQQEPWDTETPAHAHECGHSIGDGNPDDPNYTFCDLPANHAGPHHYPNPHQTAPTTDNGPNGPYTGRVLAFREYNGYDDSDFYALIEDDDGTFRWIGTGTTRAGGGFIATPDAENDVQARYTAWYLARKAEVQAEQAAYEETLIKPGRVAYIAGGRKHKGKTGTVRWIGEDKYKSNHSAVHYRAKVETDDGETFFVPADYIHLQTSNGAYIPANETSRYSEQQIPPGTSAAAYAFSEYPDPSRTGPPKKRL